MANWKHAWARVLEPKLLDIGGKGATEVEPLQKKSFNSPDEVVAPAPKVRSERVHVMGKTLRRVTLDTGWRFKEHSGPARGTELCEEFHVKLFFGGRFVAAYPDGSQEEFRAGDIGILEKGHDAWVEGDEPVVFIDLAELITEAGGTQPRPAVS